MNNTKRLEARAQLESRMEELRAVARDSDDWRYKNELNARAGGIQEALNVLDPHN